MDRSIALLRAVNVSGRMLPMAKLRDLCASLGWEEVETYIQSGNVVFRAAGRPGTLEAMLETATERQFGLDVPVMIRGRREWAALVGANPFPGAARDAPNGLQLLVSKRPPNADAAARLVERAAAGERIEAAGGALWIHYPDGVGKSKLTPTLIDRAIGSPATGRNWRTVVKLARMVE